jgi:hypothetical protein
MVGINASCPSAIEYYLLYCAGMNWHLFDTIDVVKYKTGLTVHLSTDTLISLNATASFVNGAQLPVAGVPMPGWSSTGGVVTSTAVTYGIVQGTNIGYIYVYHYNAGAEFTAAVDALAHTHGLIIDLRFDPGGGADLAAIARLTTYAGPTVVTKTRSSSTDLWSLVTVPGLDYPMQQDSLTYQHPIAVLLGPTCISTGDWFAWELTYLNNVRFFGKSANGAHSGMSERQPYAAGFELFCPEVTEGDPRSPGTTLWAQEFPVDENVWLTRDGAAKGEDDVVKRAREWITTLSYAHDVQVSRQGSDTVQVTGKVENPLSHTLKVVLTFRDTSGSVADSALMYNDGLHGDGAAGDSVWGGRYLPTVESIYHVSIRTDDLSAGTSTSIPNVTQFIFARKAILSVDTRTVALGNIYHALSRFDTTFQVSNIGWSPDSIYVSLDPIMTPDSAISVSPIAFALAPSGSEAVTFSVMPHWLSKGVNYNAVVILDSRFGFGQTHFEKAFSFAITAVGEEPSLPKAFALEQNYPNPFNPSTTIEYELPGASEVRLSVYDMLGREISILVHERREAGVHEVKFDGLNLASGVYFYRLQAGTFLDTKRFVLLK